MQRYFQRNDIALWKELESWLGTPYRHYAGVKTKGVDCIHMVVKVLENLKANQGRNLIVPPYPKDWHLHRGEKLLIREIEKQLFVEKIAFIKNDKLVFSENIDDGDIVLFKFGRHSAHCGIYFGGQVYQTLNTSGVEKINFFNRDFYNRITHIYKIYKV